FLQSRQGRMVKVNARTGDATPLFDAEKLKDSLKALKDLSPTAADQLVRSPFLRMTKDRTAVLVDVGPNVAIAYFDGKPAVQLTVAPAAGGDVAYLDLTGYPPDKTVIARVGWVAGTKTPFAYVQNREQTWLDFVTWPDWKGPPVKLFRETTKAWVEDLGEPAFLKDGSFLIHSERSGYKHLYHYARDGKLLGPVTAGE